VLAWPLKVCASVKGEAMVVVVQCAPLSVVWAMESVVAEDSSAQPLPLGRKKTPLKDEGVGP